MRIRFLQSIAGEHFACRPKQVAELDDELALKFIASGIAARVEESLIETAAVAAPQNRARRTSGKRA